MESYQAVEHEEDYYGCSGYLRTGFIQTQVHFVNTTSASAVAAELGCGYRLNSYVKAHLGIFGVLNSGLNSHNDDNLHGEFFNANKESYLMLGEAVLTLSYENFEAHLGRQNFDSPHLDSDDLRMVANLFEAYLVDYHFIENLYGGAGFIREASGWENGVNASHFISIGEALGGKQSGAWVSWLSYEQAFLTGNAWFYLIPDHLVMTYGELIMRHDLTESISYSLGVQYDGGHSIGRHELGLIEAHTFGVMGAVSIHGLTLTAAYNKNFGKSGALASIGGGAFFTSLEDQTLDAVIGVDSQSYLIGLDYTLNDHINFGIVFGEFNAMNKHDYQTEEINYFINYNWNDTLTTELIYARVDDKNSNEDTNQLRAIITYRY
ncbi:MAG: OprD family outer membrane porin [Methylococcales bacterium]|nr:OprD family outer membrane porin [Methylococcales bacterium]